MAGEEVDNSYLKTGARKMAGAGAGTMAGAEVEQ